MNRLLARIAMVACIAFPTLASATFNTDPTSAIQSDRDSFDFTLAKKSTVSIDYTWSDMLVERTSYWVIVPLAQTHSYENGTLTWTLSGTASNTGSLADTDQQSSGTGTLALGVLAAGSYTLTLNGGWTIPEQVTDNGWGLWTRNDVVRDGDVNLLDGDKLNCSGAEKNSFHATAVASVPEPETYAMLLAGLGLMGFVARRRSRG